MMNQYRSLDAGLQQKLEDLDRDYARNQKLAFKLEEGRSYPLRQQFYEMKMQRALDKQLTKDSITEKHW